MIRMEALGSATSLFSAMPMDWLILGGLIILIALDSLRSGVGRALTIALALPLVYLLFTLVPMSILGGGDLLASTAAQAGLFGALFVAMFFLVRRMGLDYMDSGAGEPLQAIIAGGAVAVIVACIWLQVPVLSDSWALSDQLSTVFAESYRLIWLAGAYAALAFARG